MECWNLTERICIYKGLQWKQIQQLYTVPVFPSEKDHVGSVWTPVGKVGLQMFRKNLFIYVFSFFVISLEVLTTEILGLGVLRQTTISPA